MQWSFNWMKFGTAVFWERNMTLAFSVNLMRMKSSFQARQEFENESQGKCLVGHTKRILSLQNRCVNICIIQPQAFHSM